MMKYLAKKKATKNKTTNIHHYWGERKNGKYFSKKKSSIVQTKENIDKST